MFATAVAVPYLAVAAGKCNICVPLEWPLHSLPVAILSPDFADAVAASEVQVHWVDTGDARDHCVRKQTTPCSKTKHGNGAAEQ